MGLRVFDSVLFVVSVVLLVATVAALPIGYAAVTGRGTVTIDAEIDPPYTVGFYDEREVEVAGGGGGAMVNFPIGEEHRYLDDWPSVRAPVKVDREDTDTRAVLVTFVGAWLGLSWLGLTSLRRIVRSACDGEPFHPRNVARLRWLAAAVIANPVITAVMVRVVESTLDADPPVSVLTPGPSLWVYVLIGLGLLALAEVFRTGTTLRELERATI